MSAKMDILPANGKLGILLPGLGAVATTFIAGVEAVRQGESQPDRGMTKLAVHERFEIVGIHERGVVAALARKARQIATRGVVRVR